MLSVITIATLLFALVDRAHGLERRYPQQTPYSNTTSSTRPSLSTSAILTAPFSQSVELSSVVTTSTSQSVELSSVTTTSTAQSVEPSSQPINLSTLGVDTLIRSTISLSLSPSAASSGSTATSSHTVHTVNPLQSQATTSAATLSHNTTRPALTRSTGTLSAIPMQNTTRSASPSAASPSSNTTAGGFFPQITQAPNFDVGALNSNDSAAYFSAGLGSIDLSSWLSMAGVSVSDRHPRNCSKTSYAFPPATAARSAVRSVETVTITIAARKETYCDTITIQPSDLSSAFAQYTRGCFSDPHALRCRGPPINQGPGSNGPLSSGVLPVSDQTISKITVTSYQPDPTSVQTPLMTPHAGQEVPSQGHEFTPGPPRTMVPTKSVTFEAGLPLGPVFTTESVVVSVIPTAIIVGTHIIATNAATAVTLDGGAVVTAGPLGVAIGNGELIPFAAAPGFPPTGTIGDTTFSFVPGGVSVAGTSLALTAPTSVSLPGGSTVTVDQNGNLQIDGTTVHPPTVLEGPLQGVVQSKSFTYVPGSIVISGTTLLTTKPTAISLSNGQQVVIGAGGVVQVGGAVLSPNAVLSGGNMNGVSFSADGAHLTIDGHSVNVASSTLVTIAPSETVTVGNGQVLFNGTPVPIPNYSPVPTAGVAGGQYYSFNSAGQLIIDSQTLDLSRPTATVLQDGNAVTVGPGGVLLNRTPIPIPPSITAAGIVATPFSTITTHGLTFSVGNYEVVVSGSTFFVPPGATRISIPIGSQTITIGPGGITFPETTIAIAGANGISTSTSFTPSTVSRASVAGQQTSALPAVTSTRHNSAMSSWTSESLRNLLILCGLTNLLFYIVY